MSPRPCLLALLMALAGLSSLPGPLSRPQAEAAALDAPHAVGLLRARGPVAVRPAVAPVWAAGAVAGAGAWPADAAAASAAEGFIAWFRAPQESAGPMPPLPLHAAGGLWPAGGAVDIPLDLDLVLGRAESRFAVDIDLGWTGRLDIDLAAIGAPPELDIDLASLGAQPGPGIDVQVPAAGRAADRGGAEAGLDVAAPAPVADVAVAPPAGPAAPGGRPDIDLERIAADVPAGTDGLLAAAQPAARSVSPPAVPDAEPPGRGAERLSTIERFAERFPLQPKADDAAAAPAAGAESAEAQHFAGEKLALDESQLDRIRGGFEMPGGVTMSFGIERAVYINGVLQTTTTLQVVPGGADTGVSPGLSVVQNGPGNTVVTGPVSSLPVGGAVIQNTLDGQAIQHITTINATVNSVQALKAQNFESALRGAIVDSLRR
ncbi:hypothetical protein LOC51_16905 [Rubrivivax sp. JA1024]|nr:hypothetical protein [Rubrivivax sp. JA1024]